MGYKEDLNALVDRYYQDVLEKYKVTVGTAMEKGRKLSLFRKQDYKPEIAAFQAYQEAARKIGEKAELICVDAGDKLGTSLKEMLLISLSDFRKLCERNAEYYDLMERKQYARNGIGAQDVKMSFAGVNSAMGPALESLDILDRAHRLFNGEEVQVDEADLIPDGDESEADKE